MLKAPSVVMEVAGGQYVCVKFLGNNRRTTFATKRRLEQFVVTRLFFSRSHPLKTMRSRTLKTTRKRKCSSFVLLFRTVAGDVEISEYFFTRVKNSFGPFIS